MKNLLILIFVAQVSFLHAQLVFGGMTVEYDLNQQVSSNSGLSYYNNLLANDPLNAELLLKRSEILKSLNKENEALIDKNLALTINPYSPLFVSEESRKNLFEIRNFGYFVRNLKNATADAKIFSKSFILEAEYSRVLDASNISKKSKLLLQSTIESIQKKDYINAKVRLSYIPIIDRANALYYDLKGVLHMEEEEFEKAIRMFTQAIHIDERFTIAYHNRAVAYKSVGDFDASEKDFKIALEQRADIAQIKFSKAKMHELKGDAIGARSFYENAIETDENYLEARLNYSTILKAAGEYNTAMQEINKLIEEHPNMSEHYYVRGGLYFIYGEYSNAAEDFDIYLETHPEDSDVLFYQGLAQVLGGQVAKGCDAISTSISNGFDKYKDISLYMCN